MSGCDDKHIRKALELARQLIILADEAELESEDDGCCVLCGVIRDCAYKIRGHADREREAHELSSASVPQNGQAGACAGT